MARIKKLLIACAIVVLFVGSGIYFDAKSNGPRKVSVAFNPNLIILPTTTLNVTLKMVQNVKGASEGDGYYLVHFKERPDKAVAVKFFDTIKSPDYSEVRAFMPYNAYLCYLRSSQLEALGEIPEIDWVGEWKPEYKISKNVNENVATTATSQGVRMDETGGLEQQKISQPKDEFTLYLFYEVDPNIFASEVLDEMKLNVEFFSTTYNPGSGRSVYRVHIKVKGDTQPTLEKIASMNGVFFIDRWFRMTTENDTDTWIIQTNVSGNRKVFNSGYTGAGQRVALSDSGIDMDHLMFWDAATGLPDHTLNAGRRKVISYYNWYETCRTDAGGNCVKEADGHYAPGDGYYPLVGDPKYNVYDWDILQGHGSHTSGTIAGEWPSGIVLPTWGVLTTPGYDFYEGNAFGAKLVFQDLGRDDDPAVYPPPDLNDATPLGNLHGVPFPGTVPLFPQAMSNLAYIHSNSWGGGSYGYYDQYSMDIDEMMWANKDFLVIFSNGNDGPGVITITPPATAKDCLSVGAAETPESFPGANSENVAYFSSWGPADPNGWTRVKPDVIAPGYYLFSAQNDDLTPGPAPNDGLIGYAGTSMAAPTVAGASALIREYYTTGGYTPVGSSSGFQAGGAFTPSAAMMKATIIDSAQPMTGTNTGGTIPGYGQGWGRVLLDNALYFAGDTRSLLIDDYTAGLDGAGIVRPFFKAYTLSVGPGQPLDITVAYTDPPATVGSTSDMVNYLYVELDHPNGSTYYLSGDGNFSGGQSVANTSFIYPDTVQKIRRNNPDPGVYTLYVVAFQTDQVTPGWNVQPYALAVSGNIVQSQGYVQYDQDYYSIGSTLNITLTDADLAGNINHSVTLTSAATGDSESASLPDNGASVGIFRGTFPTAAGVANPGDGTLQVADPDTLTVTYNDAAPAGIRTDTALIDSTPPVISNIAINSCNGAGVEITWDTDEPSTSLVHWGTTPAYGNTVSDATLVLNHYLQFDSLQMGWTYYFEMCSRDQAGNTACLGPYSFSTPMIYTPPQYHAGYVAETDYGVVLDDDDMWTGHNTTYAGIRHGIFQFDLSSLPLNAYIRSAQITIFKQDEQLDPTQADTWSANLINFQTDVATNATFNNIHNALALETLQTWTTAQLNAGGPGTAYTFSANNIELYNPSGCRANFLTLRMDGATTGDSIFSWDTGFRQDLGSIGVCYKPQLVITYDLSGTCRPVTYNQNVTNTQIDNQMRPAAANHIAEGNSLLAAANDLISQAKAKGKDASACETLAGEAKELLLKARASLDNSIYANNLALQALAKLNQAIDCLTALG